jgi:predicted SAM-dependent methyltransferase
MKINLGAGPHAKPGFVNCDCRGLPGVDRVFDLADFPWPFEDRSAEYICSEETIEHLPYLVVENFFKECYRILAHGGSLYLQCPDIGTMCEMYAANEVCDCVPHKAERFEDFKSDPECPKCHGMARINFTRWLMAFIGAQKHEWDFHRMIFTREILHDYLKKAGFHNINFRNNIYKLKVTAVKL